MNEAALVWKESLDMGIDSTTKQMSPRPWRALADEPTPFVAIDHDIMQENLMTMAEHAKASEVALRPHVKTHRTPEIARLQLRSGATGICTAKISEAEAFVDAGIDDITVAYPLYDGACLRRAVALARRATVRFCVDSSAMTRRISDYLRTIDLQLELLVIVDTGHGRDGLRPDQAMDLVVEVASMPGMSFGGILTHEGYAYKQRSRDDLRRVAIEAGTAMADLATSLETKGIEVPVVSVGSTATAQIISTVNGITEIRPGGYPFNDYGQVALGTVDLAACAGRVVATVVSSNEPGRAIIDAGSNILGSAPLSAVISSGRDEYGLVLDMAGWSIHSVSEEHGWLRWDGSGPVPKLRVGEVIQIVPVHICSVFHGAGRVLVTQDKAIIAEWVGSARGLSQ